MNDKQKHYYYRDKLTKNLAECWLRIDTDFYTTQETIDKWNSQSLNYTYSLTHKQNILKGFQVTQLQSERIQPPMKLNIDRQALIASVKAFIEAKTKEHEDQLSNFNTVKSSLTNLISVNSKDASTIEGCVNRALINLGYGETPVISPQVATVQSLLTKLNLSTDSTLEMEDNSSHFAFLN